MHRVLFSILPIYTILFFLGSRTPKGQVLGMTAGSYLYNIEEEKEHDLLFLKTVLETKTAFDQNEIIEYENIPFSTEYVDDKELIYGEEIVDREGSVGNMAKTFLVTSWLEEEIDRILLSTETTEPKARVVRKGKKIVWRELKTPDEGKIKYWHKMRVWATKYDSTCPGCNHTTAVGAYVQKGVCAVDPKVIPLWTTFYVEGYGKCTALDVGGGIKGNEIDLAFEDASKAGWGAAFTDIYLINNPPE